MPHIKSRFNPNTNLWEIGYWKFGMFVIMGSYPELSEWQKLSYCSEEWEKDSNIITEYSSDNYDKERDQYR